MPAMTPFFAPDTRHLGWFDGQHVFDLALDWVAVHDRGHLFSTRTWQWLGPLHEGSFLDRGGRPVAWLLGAVPAGRLAPPAPMSPARPLRPKRPLRPHAPLLPPRPLAPAVGWSRLGWSEWLAHGAAPEPPEAADAAAAGEAGAPAAGYAIEPLEGAGFHEFLRYLEDHLADNGRDGVYFAPLPRAESHVPPELVESLLEGRRVEVGAPGWRRLWVLRDRGAGGAIAGHVDLRGHASRHSAHRALLGMGVHRDHRRRGLARRLLAHAQDWAARQPGLAWIDLTVLSTNEAAVALYRAADFQVHGGLPDRFILDGRSVGELFMSRRVPRA
jgi:ribosomal protein S18 acetylase RimI-like enzyme